MMNATQLKASVTVAILVIGITLGCFVSFSDDVTAKQSTGILIDFGDYDIDWIDVDVKRYNDPLALLEYGCDNLSYSYTVDNGVVKEINGVYSNDERSWSTWVIIDSKWVKKGNDMSPKDYSVIAWAYCSEDEEPVIAVDALGNSIFGYPRANRVVSLSPSVTEIIGSLSAVTTLVGTDLYSNYPNSVVEGHEDGSIAVVGGYTNPSFEKIVACDPDMVICDGSQCSHVEMSKKLNKYGITAVTIYDGTDIDAIKDNIFIAGNVIGYDIAAHSVISDISNAVDNVTHRVMSNPSHSDVRTLITLSGDKAPYASGDNTYADDTLDYVSGVNVISQTGWVHISSEIIADRNPDVIIVVSSAYSNSNSDYNVLLDNLSEEWRSTDAYKNGKVYLLCEGASDLAQRSSPRVVQLMELLGRILQPEVFTDFDMPMHIGSNYEDYLVYTKNYGYDN